MIRILFFAKKNLPEDPEECSPAGCCRIPPADPHLLAVEKLHNECVSHLRMRIKTTSSGVPLNLEFRRERIYIEEDPGTPEGGYQYRTAQ